MWNLEKWYRLSYLQNRDRDRGREQTYRYQAGKGGGMNHEIETDVYTTDTMHKVDNEWD